MSHALASNGGAGDFNLALVANEAFASHAHVALPLVLPAVALEIPRWAEYALAEKPVAFRSERAVVDGFGLFNFAPRPFPDDLRRCDLDFDRTKVVFCTRSSLL